MCAALPWIGVELLEHGAVIHQGVIPLAGIVSIKRCRDQRHDIAVVHLVVTMKKEVDVDGADVGFYERFCHVKAKGGHCPSCVGADAGQ